VVCTCDGEPCPVRLGVATKQLSAHGVMAVSRWHSPCECGDSSVCDPVGILLTD
jgi:hypothetical protein